MPKFSKRSLDRLSECHPALQFLFLEVVKHIDCTILCGHRTEEEQNKMFTEGKSRCKWPMSKHNTYLSRAVDVAPYYKDKPHIRWDKKSLYRWYYFGGIVVAMSKGLIRWGGDWDGDTYVRDQRFNDLPHFELIGK